MNRLKVLGMSSIVMLWGFILASMLVFAQDISNKFQDITGLFIGLFVALLPLFLFLLAVDLFMVRVLKMEKGIFARIFRL